MSGTPTNLVLLGVRAQSDLETYMHSVGVQGINSIVEGASKKITFMKGFISHDAFGSHPVRTFRHLNQNEECILIIRHTNPATPEPQELCRLINNTLKSNLSHLNRSKGYMIDIFAGSLSDVSTAYQFLPPSGIAQGYGLFIYDHAFLPAEFLSDTLTSNLEPSISGGGAGIPRLMSDCTPSNGTFKFTEGLEASHNPAPSNTNYHNPAARSPEYLSPTPPQHTAGNYQQGQYYPQQYGGPGQLNYGPPATRHHG